MTCRPVHSARAEDHFKLAVARLQNAIPAEVCSQLEEISLFNLVDANTSNVNTAELETILEHLIRARKEFSTAQNRKKSFKTILKGWLQASYPFANLLLTVAKEGTSVPSYCFATLLICEIPALNRLDRWMLILNSPLARRSSS